MTSTLFRRHENNVDQSTLYQRGFTNGELRSINQRRSINVYFVVMKVTPVQFTFSTIAWERCFNVVARWELTLENHLQFLRCTLRLL